MKKAAPGQGHATDESAKEVPEPAAPTRDEAKVMFRANPGLAHVLTDVGWMSRDQC